LHDNADKQEVGMTPKRGFLKSTLRRGAAVGGFLALSACGGAEPLGAGEAPPADDPLGVIFAEAGSAFVPAGSARERIERDLGRLEALSVVQVEGLFETATAHSWIPYGGFWSETQVSLSEDEQAERLADLVDRAEAAAAAVSSLEESMAADNGFDSLCFPAGEHYCLTIAQLDADLAALEEVEVVHVSDIVRSNQEVAGACYSSWEPVTAKDWERAYELRALVEATRDLVPSAPEEPGE
jgi:hypothetical protein